MILKEIKNEEELEESLLRLDQLLVKKNNTLNEN